MSSNFDLSATASFNEFFDFDEASSPFTSQDVQLEPSDDTYDIQIHPSALAAIVAQHEAVNNDPVEYELSDDAQLGNWHFNESEASTWTFAEMTPATNTSNANPIGHETPQLPGLESQVLVMPTNVIGQTPSAPWAALANPPIQHGTSLPVTGPNENE
ncbi:hypothetical protein MMC19_001494 [Ptychographa xylographoides]|nr:hypothetical protein [Ptychographa xylographoides]